MALLTDKKTEKDLSERLSEFVQFGTVLNYMLDNEKVELSDLEKMFFDSDRDKATLVYSSLLRGIKPEYFEESYRIYSGIFPNDDGYDSSEYARYLNKKCISSIITKMTERDRLDRTYINTYDFLLENSDVHFARK